MTEALIIPARRRGRPTRAEAGDIDSRLIELARAEFIRRGYGQSNLTAVARAAGITKMTLYRKFPTKADLFRAVVNASVHHFVAAFEVAEGADLEQALTAIGQRLLAEWKGDLVEIMRLVFAEARRFPELSRVLRDLSQETQNAVTPVLERFAPEGVDHQAAAAFLLRLYFMGPNHHLMAGGDAPYDAGALKRDLAAAVRVFAASWRGVFAR